MTTIPVNPDDYPTETEPMDVGVSYKVMVTKCEMSPKLDKNGNNYFAVETEVLEPEEYAGSTLSRNYIAVPPSVPQTRKEKNMGITYSRFCHCFGVRPGPDGVDLNNAIGNVGSVIIEQGEYMGRKTFSIKDFLLSS